MSLRERDVLARLVDSLAETDDERRELRGLQLADLNHHAAMEAVATLRQDERRHLFDTCLDVLVADQQLGKSEVAFLHKLRGPCGVSWWDLERRLLRLSLRRKMGVHNPLLQGVIVIALVAFFIGWAYLALDSASPPKAAAEHPGIRLAERPMMTADLDAEELFQEVRRSVVTVQVVVGTDRQCSGSGAIIGQDAAGRSYVLTNRHVIDCAKRRSDKAVFEVLHDSGARFAAELDFRSVQHDLALLAVDGIGEFSRPVSLRPRAELHVGESVYALGSPLRLRGTFTSGIISALRQDRLQTDAAIGPGSSGGPLFDRHGMLCGVITEGYPGRAIGLALYADAALEMLEARALRKAENAAKP